MEEIKITKEAYNLIKHECLQCEIETGGLLIGTLKNLIVLEATPPGGKARSTFTSFTSDSEFDRMMLNKAIEKYEGRVKLLGYWHKHPGTMSQPSLGDMKQVKVLIKDIAKDKDNRPLFIFIVNVIKDEVKIYAYSIKYGHKFESMNLSVIDDNSEEIKEALKNEPVLIKTRDTSFWTDPNFQFYFTRVGKKRLKQEIEELKDSGYEVKILRKSTTKRVYLEISKYKIAFICIPPIEYPLNPPKIFINNHLVSLPFQDWNSDCTIKQALDITLKKMLSQVKPYQKKQVQIERGLFNEIIKATFNYFIVVKDLLIGGKSGK